MCHVTQECPDSTARCVRFVNKLHSRSAFSCCPPEPDQTVRLTAGAVFCNAGATRACSVQRQLQHVANCLLIHLRWEPLCNCRALCVTQQAVNRPFRASPVKARERTAHARVHYLRHLCSVRARGKVSPLSVEIAP